MSNGEAYFLAIDGLHKHEYNVSLGYFLAICVERLRQKGLTEQSGTRILHDHLELASICNAPFEEEQDDRAN